MTEQMLLKGIVPPLITPLKDRDTLDVEGLERLIEHMIGGGIHGLFALGTTGEGPSLGYRLRAEVIHQVCRQVNGRIPVVVGITDTAFVESVKLSRIAAEAGADGVVLSTPYYFPAGQTELAEYVRKLVPELALPVMLYNMPSLTKVWFEIETLHRLAGLERVVGVKDSSGDMDYYSKLCNLQSERPDWSFLIGPEEKLIASILMGGHGGVNGGANVLPHLFVEAYEAAVAGDAARCEMLQQRIEAFGEIYRIGKYPSRFIKATKCAASILGLCDDFMAEPFNRFYPQDREKVKIIFEKLGIISCSKTRSPGLCD
ncbi:MAG: dihydrodipicolinate synthase family protein [Kiritimatiellales bacterium]|nr:dihydrodipicolinate synthase family protein [Kiritimatiellales bacterium]MCF7863500.1 dihydrodipicolinate synthase family protein [Kiritimatiellales bacterium]